MKQAIHLIANLDPASGGPSVCVPELARAVAGTHRYDASLFTFGAPAAGFLRFAARSRGADLLHVHGLWQMPTLAGSLAAGPHRPLIVSAHGMLDPWALDNKCWKKRFYAAAIELHNLRRAACLHALSEAEVADYRRIGLTNPVAVIPNGVHTPPPANAELFLDTFPSLRGHRIALFLGRVHYKKGIDTLCRAWSAAGPAPAWKLVIAGADSENTEAPVRELCRELGIAGSVLFTGPLYGARKWSALAAAHLFVLPSFSEGFSVAVLEAMASALPVLLTNRCNFPEVAEKGCGWVVEPNTVELADALRMILPASSAALTTRGVNARALVTAHYTWDAIGAQMASVYDWMLGGSEPACLLR